jgi:tetratricopeptide (TPR) repeat protein
VFRAHKLTVALVTAYALALVSHGAAAQDFDPNGRHGHHGGGGGQPHGGGGQPHGGGNNGGGVQPVQSPQVLIDRYTKIVLSQPGSVFPLQRLAQLYREKDGNLKGLISDFEKRSQTTGADQYAAVVSLAGIYKIEGRIDDAVRTYEQGIALKPADPSAVLALAHAYQDRGDAVNARTRFAQALPLQTAQTDKEQTLRTLMSLALDAKDWAGAVTYHESLVKLEPTSLYVKGELGRELFSRGEYERAETEFASLVTAATGDNRALAPALKDLGKAQAKAHKNKEALATLKKALAVAGQEAAVRAEIYETITEIYRADQQLPILIKQLEDEHPNDFARLRLLGMLYEETGDATNAIATYRKALAITPRDIDLRLKMVRLLQSQGELEKAIAEYEALIRAAPNNPQFVFEECEALLQRGERDRALRLLNELEARASNDEESLSRLADFYGRIGEADKSMRVLTKLTQIGSADPSHLVDLGDHYFQEGNTALAITTWKRILTTITPRSRALAALADVFLEHDMTDDALTSIREAVTLEPQNINFKKQLAGALERKQDRAGARAIWAELSDKARQTGDKLLARETRTHIVTLLSIEHLLDAQIPIWQAQFNKANQPDIEAGRTLAEAQIHQRKLGDAEITLRRVIELAPGDSDSYLALERVLVQGNKLQDAIAVLEKLLAVDPKQARGIYQRMSTYALQLYHDDDAIKYASRAVELNPDDAEGHRRLGEMYRQRQDTEHAITEFRAAIVKNDRLFVVFFDLADLLLAKGLTDEADRLYRRVIRASPDIEFVARAAALSKQINLGRGTLESLEQELLPLAIGNPQRPIYRVTLVQIYGDLTFSLMQRVRHGEGKDADEARASLAKIGARAVKPLLDALADGDTMQQRIAIDVLGYVQNKNAGPALFAFATGQAELPLRVRAMIACGGMRDPNMLGKFQTLLVPKQGSDEAMPADAVAVAAAWGVARVNDRRAIPMLRTLAKKGTPEMRAVAMLGLAQLKDRTSTADVAAVAKAQDSGTIARAAAAYALGELGAESEAPTLLALAQGNDALPRELALVSLARMGAAKSADPPGGKAAIAAMSDAVFAGGETQSARARLAGEAIQRAGTAALTLLATPQLAKAQTDLLPVPDGMLDVEGTLDQLVPRNFSETARAAALMKFGEPLQRAALSALQTSGDRARTVLDSLGGGDGSFKPFVSGDSTTAPATAKAKAVEIGKNLESAIVPLARHPNAQTRMEAVVLLARAGSADAQTAVVGAVDDADEQVQRVALAAIGARADAAAVTAVTKLLRNHENWAMRVLGAQALGRLGAAGSGADATKALTSAAQTDGYALVREAALVALASYDKAAASQVAATIAQKDAEPRVRETAKRIATSR